MAHKPTIQFCLTLLFLAQASLLQAHFPWLVREADGKVIFFFGEGLNDRTYHMPPAVGAAKLLQFAADGTPTEIARDQVETEELVGLASTHPVPADAVVGSEVTYGIYHGTKLTYTTFSLSNQLPKSVGAFQKQVSDFDLRAVPVATDKGIDVFVIWKGKPLGDAKVRLMSANEDHDGGNEATTDAHGKASFPSDQIEPGINALLVGQDYDEAGELAGGNYKSASNYLTLTFESSKKPSAADSLEADDNVSLAPIPLPITSFGAARIGDALYVYGGHTGEPHTYSNEGQSNQLLKLDLNDDDGTWQQVATGDKLQGLAMVAHHNQLIILGGLTARNSEGEPNDLVSQSTVRAFDATTGSWSDLPPLPAPRSSHDAAIIGDTIYVVGGWNLHGDSSGGEWHTSALALDLSAENPRWQEVPAPTFARRGLAVVAHRDQLFVIGGMDEKRGPTREVDVYDPNSKSWIDVADLPTEAPLKGFGAAAWSVGGKLVATTHDGDLQQWDDGSKTWTKVGEVADGRFFHRLLPLDDHQIVAVGGANMESGKFVNLETIEVK